MSTVRERFEEYFNTSMLMRLSRVKVIKAHDDIRAFFRQELLALADTVAGMAELTVPDRDRVEEFIRSKADELK